MEDVTPQDGVAYRELSTAIGHLFVAFATFESAMVSTLKLHLASRIEPDPDKPDGLRLSAAIYGSQRFKNSKDAMKRIMEAEGVPQPVKSAIDAVFKQAGDIEQLRNGIAHQPIFPLRGEHEGRWAYTDFFSTKDTEKVQTYHFDVEALRCAGSDLVKAAQVISEMRGSTTLFDPAYAPASQTPWRYKPAMLVRLQGGTDPKSQ